jgi:protein-S-isoprenylcysteine O-methyltransferase Ste14
MILVAMGALGFAIIHLCDIAALKKVPWAKPIAWLSGGGLLTYASVMVCLSPEKLPLPGWLTYLGWPLLIISLSWLIYSLFINLPFGKTYIATGVGDRLITTGLYALVRHPGVPWFIIVMLSLILVSGSRLWLAAAPVWIALDILLVVIQDRFFFGRMFKGYDDYRRTTPMLVPDRKSLSAFLSQLRSAANR